jgi:hypothetical protein
MPALTVLSGAGQWPMFLIGSYALALLDHQPFDTVKDLDLVGVEDDVTLFRSLNQDIIERERQDHGHHQVFHLKAGQPLERVEIEFEQSPSDKMLPALCERQTTIMGLVPRQHLWPRFEVVI